MIPYGRQSISDEDIESVVEVLRSDYLTQGPKVPEFEKAIANCVAAKHAVAVNSATSALHIACLALEVAAGDIVWTVPNTFVASANCALYCGAVVDFVDIDSKTHNMSVAALEKKLQIASEKNKLPKVVIPVHLSGEPCDMEAIAKLSSRYGFSVIEDASHAIGGEYKGLPIGSCQYSDIAVFSFHPVKIMTTAEGGMAMTNDKALADRMSRLRSHGITRDPDLMTHEPDGAWYYQQIELGFNYRMTELQAALGLSQLSRLKEFVSARHRLAERYDSLLSDLPVITPYRSPSSYSAFHLYIIRLKLDLIPITHREAFEKMRAKGILVNLHYIPVHTQPYYKNLGFSPGDFPEAEKYYSEAITLPLYPGLKYAEQDNVISVLRDALQS